MKDDYLDANLQAAMRLNRIAAGLGLSLLFHILVVVIIIGIGNYLNPSVSGLLFRTIFWPATVYCVCNPQDIICPMPGLVFSFLFYWLMFCALLRWCGAFDSRKGLSS